MLPPILTLAAATLLAAPAGVSLPLRSVQEAPVPAPAAASATQAPDTTVSDARPASRLTPDAQELLQRVDAFREAEPWFGVPSTVPLADGPRVVAPGETIAGDVASANGTLEIHGVVLGSAVAYGGDVVIHPTGRVAGDAVAILGRVRQHEGGRVDGEARSIRGSIDPAPAVATRTAAAAIRSDVGLVIGWLTVLVIIGVGVLIFASRPLDGVVETLERDFGRSVLAGVLGQLALVPALILVIVGLAITILGILLIPFAVVAFVLGVVGLMTLGFLSVARVTGGALLRRPPGRLSERGAVLRALVVGIAAFLVFWVLAAVLAPVPLVATMVRAFAFTVTWVGVTAGFGAAILSRAGTRRGGVVTALRVEEEAEEEISWQTPTPIGGVAAARRPTSSHR